MAMEPPHLLGMCQAESSPSASASRPSALQAKSPTPEPPLAMPTSVPRKRAAVMLEASFAGHDLFYYFWMTPLAKWGG